MLRTFARWALGRTPPPNLLAERYPEYPVGRGSYGDLEIVRYPGDAGFSMGAYCSVAAGVKVMLGGEHRPDWVTTYPFNEWDRDRFGEIAGHPRTKGDVSIGNDVWIAREAMIMSGVRIGDGAVIAARAVVTRDVPPYSIVGGNPAKLIRMRFSPDVIERLMQVRWWSWPEDRLGGAVRALMSQDIEGFLAAAEQGEL
jgi:chloramphenicol O-acetyltransferase type B